MILSFEELYSNVYTLTAG